MTLPESATREALLRENAQLKKRVAGLEATVAAHEHEARQLAAIVESSDDAIVSKNLESVVQTWNGGAERIFGYTAEEIIGSPVTILIPPECHDEEPAILQRIRRGERIEHYDAVRRHKSGRLVHVSLTVSPIKDESGRIVGASKIARDISARKKTEEALAQRTRTLEVLNRVGVELVAERDVEAILRTVATAAQEIGGFAHAAFFTGDGDGHGNGCVLRGLSEERNSAFLEVVKQRAPEVATRMGEAPDGRHRKPDTTAPALPGYLEVPLRSGAGEVLGSLFFGDADPDKFTPEVADVVRALATQAAIAINGAHLYRAVQRELIEHKRAREEVRAREEQLRLVTNHAPVLLLQCDREYRYRFVNLPYATRYGHAPEELIGKTIAEIVGQEAFLSAKPHIDATLQGERVEFELEASYQKIGARWVHVIFVPELGGAGEVIGLVGVLTDITQRKSAEKELERARDEALAASRAKDDFLAALSHELRTPLNPVLLLASDGAEDLSLAPEVRRTFETIRRQVNLEARLIDDLLDLTRITRRKFSLERHALDAHQVLADVVATVRPEFEGKKLRFELQTVAAHSVVFGDPVRLQQVFWNVLKNAVKFTPAGGRIVVRTESNVRSGRLRVSVEDTGIGLTQAEVAGVFEAFSQGEHATSGGPHRFGGLGLGLAISRSIVEMHGGRIGAESEGRDRGATFFIELPLMSENPPDENSGPGEVSTEPAPAGATFRGRLLVIEDHQPTRATLKNLLTRRNFEVHTAGNAHEAREIARQHAPDLVISDIGLPDADGCSLMIELRDSHPGLAGIALSGYGMDEDLARTRAAGFVEHLTKPVNVGALERAIEKIFAERGARPKA